MLPAHPIGFSLDSGHRAWSETRGQLLPHLSSCTSFARDLQQVMRIKHCTGLGELGSSTGWCQSKGKQGDRGWGWDAMAVPTFPPGRAAQRCCPQAGTEELHPKTGSCGEGQSSLMLLRWGEKGVKSRVGRDGLLPPGDARPQEPGVMCRMGVPVVPACHLSPTALGEETRSRRRLLLLLPSPCTVHGPFSLHTASVGHYRSWGAFSPSDTAFLFCLSTCQR